MNRYQNENTMGSIGRISDKIKSLFVKRSKPYRVFVVVCGMTQATGILTLDIFSGIAVLVCHSNMPLIWWSDLLPEYVIWLCSVWLLLSPLRLAHSSDYSIRLTGQALAVRFSAYSCLSMTPWLRC